MFDKVFLVGTVLVTLSFTQELKNGDFVKSWKNKLHNSQNSYEKLYKSTLTPYEYLNNLRTNAGLNLLTQNQFLDMASQNHANYIVETQEIGHYETIDNHPLFTGTSPSQRAFFAGYSSSVTENLSVGQDDSFESIDDLFGAIYHRFGFLDFEIDSIGIGTNGSDIWSTYVYKMGNSNINQLCQENSYTGFGGYYSGMCEDTYFKISTSTFENAKNLNSIPFVVWPYDTYLNTPPVFYEESPDPLPNHSVSGYPASIQFNKTIFTNGVELVSFELFDINDDIISDVLLMDKLSDPNGKFNEYEFALFPLKRLEWDSHYKAKVVYLDKSTQVQNTIEWNFATRGLEMPIYKITELSKILYLNPNTTYALYLEPQHGNDLSNGYSVSYSSGIAINSSFIDLNTLSITINGQYGQNVNFTFNNGRTVNIILSEIADKPFVEQEQEEEQEEENIPSFSIDFDALSSGWNLLGAIEDINDMSIFDNIQIVWLYQNNNWYVYSSKESIKQIIENSSYKDFVITQIKKSQGFWINK